MAGIVRTVSGWAAELVSARTVPPANAGGSDGAGETRGPWGSACLFVSVGLRVDLIRVVVFHPLGIRTAKPAPIL